VFTAGRKFLVGASFTLAPLFTWDSSARAQQVVSEEKDYLVTFDEDQGDSLVSFITMYQRLTGKVIHVDDKDLKDIKVLQIGTMRVPKNRFDIYFGAVLRNLDFLMVQFGPPDAGFLTLRKLGGQGGGGRAQTALKTQAQIVLPSELDKLAENPGLLVTTSISTKYLPAREAVTTLQLYFADSATEAIRNIEGTDTILMTGFANNLQGIVRLLKEIDKEPDDAYPNVVRRKLNHAVADEIQPVLKDLIDAYMGTGRPGGGGAAPAGGGARRPAGNGPNIEPEPAVISDPHSNQLFITAGKKTMDKVLGWIDQLDVEVDPRGDTHVYRLRNSKADDIADVLTQVVQGDNRGGRSGTGTRTGTGTGGRPAGGGPAGGGPGGGGNTGGTGANGEQPVVIVPDKDTNSLVITASKTRYAQLLEIIKKLDIRSQQVLIQAALIEITASLDETLGVELAAVNTSTTSKTGFGITSFGLTTLIDTNGDGIPDTRGLNTDNFAKGLTGGIFNPKDFALPFVLNALAQKTNANILSLPSILTNDTQSATVTADDASPFAQTTQGQNSDQTTLGGTTKAGITLKISPTISAGDYLSLNINLTVSAFSGPAASPNLPPPSLERVIQTQVTLPDGHTMIFGGVITDDKRRQEDKVPILGDIPLIGFLFRNSTDSNKKTNLYFFLTPHIIKDDFATLDELTAKHKAEAEKLGGKVEMLNRFFTAKDPDSQRVSELLLDKYFELPAYASVSDRAAAPPTSDTKAEPRPEK
jgi:general secretion pathway protein D